MYLHAWEMAVKGRRGAGGGDGKRAGDWHTCYPPLPLPSLSVRRYTRALLPSSALACLVAGYLCGVSVRTRYGAGFGAERGCWYSFSGS